MKTKSLLYLFLTHLQSSSLVPYGSKGLVAVSGGVDSIVLLDLFTKVREEFQLELAVVHLNHGLRGIQADEEGNFVKRLSQGYRLDFYCEKLQPKPKGDKESWEAYARRHRYAFFERVRGQGGFDWIATAHHADDQSETILMHILEGCGLDGLKGIQSRMNKVIRPLLPFSRNQIENYARENNLSFCEDPTNKNEQIPRNFLRQQIIPLLKKHNPGLNKSLARLSDNLTEFDEFLQQWIKECTKEVVIDFSESEILIDQPKLAALPTLIQKRVVYSVMSDDKQSYPKWRKSEWERLEKFLISEETGKILQISGWRLLKDRNRIFMQRKGSKKGFDEITFFANCPQDITVGSYHFTMEQVSKPQEFFKVPSIEFIDYDALTDNKLSLRLWKPGDTMKPIGMKGFKKISDILVDRKIDRFKKESQFVLESDQKIVWLCGVQLDDRFKITDKSHHIARLCWTKRNS